MKNKIKDMETPNKKKQNTISKGWIKLVDKLPPFGKKVLFRGVLSWATGDRRVSFFSDILTSEIDTLEDYGIDTYLLKYQSDYAVMQEHYPFEYYDECITHWSEIPEDLL